MQETKYGTVPIDEILKDGILHGFEIMCTFHDLIVAMVRHFFSIYIDVIYYLIFQFSLFSPMYIHSLHFIFMFLDER